MSKVLFVATHPDDETLGCGGTILRHKAEGDQVYWLIITNVHTARGWDKEVVDTRQVEIKSVAEQYGFEETINLDFPTTLLDAQAMGKLTQAASKVIHKIQPDVMYLPNRTDVHTDHQIAFQALWSCTKNFRAPFVKRKLMYEAVSETEFSPPLQDSNFCPNVFVDISPYFTRKMEIFQTYASEVMVPPLPRSLVTIEALARYRGSRAGVQFAEAFMLIEELI